MKIIIQNDEINVQLKAIHDSLNQIANTPFMDIINSIGTIVSVAVAIISIRIAVQSLKFSTSSEEKRANAIKKENEDYLEKVNLILNKTLDEINQIVDSQSNSLSNKTTEEKLEHIKKSFPYTVQQVKSRLHIICSFEFSTMDSKRLSDLYEVRTLVAGIYNALYGYERNLIDNNFMLGEYERYLTDTLEDIEIIKSSLYLENKHNISNN